MAAEAQACLEIGTNLGLAGARFARVVGAMQDAATRAADRFSLTGQLLVNAQQ